MDFKNLLCSVKFRVDAHILQNCSVPKYLFNDLGFQLGDFIRIKTSCSKFFITRVVNFEDTTSGIAFSDGVCSSPYIRKGIFSVKNIDVLSNVVLRKVRVQIVLTNAEELVKWKKANNKEKFFSQILSTYFIVDECTIKYSECNPTKFGGIDIINVLETFISGKEVGQVCEDTKIEISEVITREHYDQRRRFEKIKLGGLSEALSCLKDATGIYGCFPGTKHGSRLLSNEILLVGPSGCGKSSLGKKLAYDCGAYLEIITCSKLVDLLPCEYEWYMYDIERKVELYSVGQCMLLIDDIDCIESSSFFEFHALEVFYQLLLRMRSKKVFVIGTATFAKALHPHLKLQGMFQKQIRLGVPTYEERKCILNTIIPQTDVNPHLDVDSIAKLSSGFVGADLLNAFLMAKRSKEEEGALISEKQVKTSSLVSTENMKDALANIKPLILNNVGYDWSLKVRPVQWDDIGGMENIKAKILQRIEVSLKHGQNTQHPWLPDTGGILLYGPPGCCKTTFVRALATKWDATFFSASPAQIYSPYVGDSEKCIAQLFHQARVCAPAIIFLDELDCLVGKRSESCVNRDIQEKVLSALLNEMDGVCMKVESIQGVQKNMVLMEGDKVPSLQSFTERKSNSGIVVIGASNRPDLIDDALLRPGRFDLLQYMAPPNRKERESILKTMMKKMPPPIMDLTWLASQTKYYSGADLQLLLKMAALSAHKRNVSQIEIKNVDFECALKKVLPSLSEEDFAVHQHFSEKYSHEIEEQ